MGVGLLFSSRLATCWEHQDTWHKYKTHMILSLWSVDRSGLEGGFQSNLLGISLIPQLPSLMNEAMKDMQVSLPENKWTLFITVTLLHTLGQNIKEIGQP